MICIIKRILSPIQHKKKNKKTTQIQQKKNEKKNTNPEKNRKSCVV